MVFFTKTLGPELQDSEKGNWGCKTAVTCVVHVMILLWIENLYFALVQSDSLTDILGDGWMNCSLQAELLPGKKWTQENDTVAFTL